MGLFEKLSDDTRKLDRVQKRLQDPRMSFKDAAADLKGLQHNFATDGDQLCLDAIENAKIRCTDWEIDVERRIRRRRQMPDELSLHGCRTICRTGD